MVKENNSPLVKPTLGLLGATMNAMALIAPGAFLWIMCQLQAAATAPRRAVVANGIWASIVVTLIVTLLTAFSHSQWAKIYPEAGVRELCLFYRGGVARCPWRKEKRPAFGGAIKLTTTI